MFAHKLNGDHIGLVDPFHAHEKRPVVIADHVDLGGSVETADEPAELFRRRLAPDHQFAAAEREFIRRIDEADGCGVRIQHLQGLCGKEKAGDGVVGEPTGQVKRGSLILPSRGACQRNEPRSHRERHGLPEINSLAWL